LTPRTKLILALPIIAAFVIALVYLQLFSSPVIIAIIFVAWLAVSLWNRRKFAKQKARKGAERARSSSVANPAFPVAVPGAVGFEYVLFQLVFRLADEAAVALQREAPPVSNRCALD
jgi:hypothetical protein